MWTELWVYIALFIDAFVAATLLPAFSEIALAALIIENVGNPAFLVLAATGGNVAGSTLNWWLGKTSIEKTKFGQKLIAKPSFERAHNLFQKFGHYSLLFAWLPVIGDPLTLIAGVFKTRLGLFIILVTIGKFARYSFVAYAAQAI